MEINNTETLLKLIRSVEEEDAIKMFDQYTNIIKRDTLNYTWNRARVLVRHIAKNRRQRVRKAMVNYDEESGMISLVQFTKFIAAIEDSATNLYEKGSIETKDAISDVITSLYQLLGNIRIDKRLIFTKED